MWEAFLLHMKDFDRFLEFELRKMLDPVVGTRPPARKRREKRTRLSILTFEVPVEIRGGIQVAEPAMVTVTVAPAQLL